MGRSIDPPVEGRIVGLNLTRAEIRQMVDELGADEVADVIADRLLAQGACPDAYEISAVCDELAVMTNQLPACSPPTSARVGRKAPGVHNAARQKRNSGLEAK